ncbi:MAG: LytR/AlgR family response regulator transcription factor [Acidothermaceae bacterium]
MPTVEIEMDAGLRVLVVDDEAPARADLEFLLQRQPAISAVVSAADATEALRLLQADQYDAVFLDVRMPGLDGIELGKLLLRFSDPPTVVFVTAHESHAVAAFEAHARGYLLKPVSNERLTDAVNVIWESRRPRRAMAANEAVAPPAHDMGNVPVESGGRTLLVDRSDVCWIQANGDYVRLHTIQGGSHLVRLPLALFEERWAAHGFVRIHRSHLVALRYVAEVRTGSAGGAIVHVAGQDLAVSRRHTAELKHRLFRVPLGDQSP